jgi:hypothetical protein
MGRIGVALALVVGWTSVAHAEMPVCTTVTFEYMRDQPEKNPDSTDTTPPAKPQITEVALSADRKERYEMVALRGTFDADTATIRVTTAGNYSIVTTPKDLRVCSETLYLREQEHISIVAYDAAGNASEPYETDVAVKVTKDESFKNAFSSLLYFLGACLASAGIFVVLIIVGVVRKKAPFSVAGEVVSPILAENVARLVTRGYVIKFAVATVVTIGLLAIHQRNLAIMAAPFVIVWLYELFMTRLVLGQFDEKIQRLEKRENWIYINSAKLYAPFDVWNKASALPSAGLAKRD